ncbi:T9SS type A sorting domain-containing protein, partial [Crocosphaera sp.]|uniref:T9SS type A sorting domain-containing protein n=1 Tax=Crocosphaera sp. TaxID=2729996 RepID=UPI00257F519E
LSLYPNPLTDYLQVEFNQEGIWEMEIYDMQGQLRWKDRWSAKSSQRRYNLSELNAGNYLLNLRQGSEVLRKQIIIK